MKNIIICLTVFSFIMADVHISGDARVRPRYDIIEYGDGSSTSDLYYLYRGRINVKADIGDGWFFKTQLGTNSVAGMTKMGALNEEESYTFNPSVSFMELYFGYKNEKCGFWAGAFPLKYNPGLDLHFYADKLVDIPFVLFSNGSVGGFAGYHTILNHQLNWFLSVDSNVTNQTINDNNETTDLKDSYTLGFNTDIPMGPLSFSPRFMMSMGEDNNVLPTTFGADMNLPKVAGFSLTASYYVSTYGNPGTDAWLSYQDSTDTFLSDEMNDYQVDHLRFLISRPVGSGKLKLFYDISSKKYNYIECYEYDGECMEYDNSTIDVITDKLSFLWLSYTYTCYKGDIGNVTISPTFRLQNGAIGNDAYSRAKFEITTQINFK